MRYLFPPMSKIVAVRPESPVATSAWPNVALASEKLRHRALRAILNQFSNARACRRRDGFASRKSLSFLRLMTFTTSHYAKALRDRQFQASRIVMLGECTRDDSARDRAAYEAASRSGRT